MSKRIFLSPPWLGGSERARVEEAFASGYIAPCGPMVDRFERAFAERTGIAHACALSSGSAALDLLFHELGIGLGDRVFCSDLTFISSIASAVQRGAEPVFIDCDETSWTMDPDLLEEALAQAVAEGRLPKAVVAVDLYGQCCDYGRIESLCEQYGVPLIIDAAEALGACYCDHGVVAGTQNSERRTQNAEAGTFNAQRSTLNAQVREREGQASACPRTQNAERRTRNAEVETFNAQGRSAGDAGWAAVFSFNGNKIITTSGGGMLASRDAGVVERARKRAQQAREPVVWYEHRELGYNFRMSNIVAAIGVGQLEALEIILAKKRQIFEWYRERLEDVPGVRLMPEAGYGRCSRWLTVVELLRPPSGRNDECKNEPSAQVMRVIEALERENIESRPVWKPMHLQPVFQGAWVVGGVVCERLFANGLCLPSGAGLERDDVERICDVVVAALAKDVSIKSHTKAQRTRRVSTD
jgi:dTDP-4-amino-4,6-dideoxygalactose transaminase